VKAADKSLEKEGASIEKIQPLLSQAIFGALTRLNMNLFPGVGISYGKTRLHHRL
jgi:hypothetical protein